MKEIKFKRYYVYVHYNKETKQILYVGKGSGNRAYLMSETRNKLWDKVKNIIGEFGVKILFETDDEKEAFTIESEVIKLLGIGNLINISEGNRYYEGYENTSEYPIIKKLKLDYLPFIEGKIVIYELDEVKRENKNKRYAIYNQANEIVGYGDNKSQLASAIGCTRQHFHQAFDGKHITYKGEEYKVIDILAYYYENQMKQ